MYSDVGLLSGLTLLGGVSSSGLLTPSSSQSGAGKHPSASIFLGVPSGSRSRDDELLINLLNTFTGGSGVESGSAMFDGIRGKVYESQLADDRTRP